MIIKLKNEKLNVILCEVLILSLPFSWMATQIGSMYRLLFFLVFGIFLFFNSKKLSIPLHNLKLFFSIALYFGYIILSTAWSINIDSSTSYMGSTIQILGMSIMFSSVAALEDETSSFEACWIAVGLLCVILFFSGGQTQLNIFSERSSLMIAGTKSDPNEYASLFAISISFTIKHVFKKKNMSIRLALIILIISEIYVVLLTGSRGALVAVLISITLTVLQQARVSIKRSAAVAITISIILYVIIHIVIPLIPNDVVQRLSLYSLLNDGGSGRSTIWKQGLMESWNGPIYRLIIGYGKNGVYVHNGYLVYTSTMHNQLIQQLVDYGIIGLILYFDILRRFYFKLKKSNQDYIPAFWAIMFMSMTITMSATYKPLWLLLFMAYLKDKKSMR